MDHQHLVGILCHILFYAPLHNSATCLTKIHRQLLAQFHAGLVHIASQIECAYLVEMTIAESVEAAHIALGPVGHRYHVVEPALHNGQSVHHALGNY